MALCLVLVGLPLGQLRAVRVEPCSCPPTACACFHAGGPKMACCLHAPGHGTTAHRAATSIRPVPQAGHSFHSSGHAGPAAPEGGANPTSAAPVCGHGHAATGAVPLDGRAVLATVAPTPTPAPAERLAAFVVRSPSPPFRRPFIPPPRRPSRLS